jgi:hypothetical protein
MKKNVLLVIFALLTTSGLKAQISSFDIAEKKAVVYLGWTPGYGETEGQQYPRNFANQNTDWIEVGAHYSVWRGLNINAGISMNVNFQSIEDMGLIYSDRIQRPDFFGDMRSPQSLYGGGYPDDEEILQMRGTIVNAGISYTFGKGSFQFIPAFGLSIGQEWNVYYWPTAIDGADQTYVHEYKREGMRGNPYLNLDIVYKNYLFGIHSNFKYQHNKDVVSLAIGYAFPLKNQSKMNF